MCKRISVVCLLIPTSNHNCPQYRRYTIWLYAFWFLHQTTTSLSEASCNSSCMPFDSYIKPQHSHVCVFKLSSCMPFDSYIKPQPKLINSFHANSCMPFDSYIKPQQWGRTTAKQPCCMPFDSYIKPQLRRWRHLPAVRCMPFDSYIKPQQCVSLPTVRDVVCLLIPTSNHNLCKLKCRLWWLYAFWFLHQTTTQ